MDAKSHAPGIGFFFEPDIDHLDESLFQPADHRFAVDLHLFSGLVIESGNIVFQRQFFSMAAKGMAIIRMAAIIMICLFIVIFLLGTLRV
jgi:hypothetical protein